MHVSVRMYVCACVCVYVCVCTHFPVCCMLSDVLMMLCVCVCVCVCVSVSEREREKERGRRGCVGAYLLQSAAFLLIKTPISVFEVNKSVCLCKKEGYVDGRATHHL